MRAVIFIIIFSLLGCSSQEKVETEVVDEYTRVTLILPISHPNKNVSAAASVVKEAFLTNYKISYANLDKKGIKLKIFLEDAYGEALEDVFKKIEKSDVDLVIGPMLSEDLVVMAKYFEDKVVSKNYLLLSQFPDKKEDTQLMSYINILQNSSNIHIFSVNPNSFVKDVVVRAWQEGYYKPYVFYYDAPWSSSIAEDFLKQAQDSGMTVAGSSKFTNIKEIRDRISSAFQVNMAKIKQFKELQLEYNTKKAQALAKNEPWPPELTPEEREALQKKLESISRKSSIDFIYFVGTPDQGRQIRPNLVLYMANDVKIFSSSYVFSGTQNASKDRDLTPIVFPDLAFLYSSSPYKTYSNVWQNNKNLQRFFALGFDAFSLMPYVSKLDKRSTLVFPYSLSLASGDVRLKNNTFTAKPIWLKFTQGVPTIMENLEPKPEELDIVDGFLQEPTGKK